MDFGDCLNQDDSRIPPCLIIGYSRLDGVIRNIHSARAAKAPRIYVSLDGPLNLEIAKIQTEILDQIKIIESNHQVDITLRVVDRNQGVALGVIGAIEWFFSLEDEGVILEDDLQIHDSFFDYCSQGLDFYRDDDRVLMVCGSQYFPGISGDSVIWTSIPQIWGWATSRRKWNLIRDYIWGLSDDARLNNSFSKENGFWSTGARRCITGKVDTWDLLLVFVFLLHKRFAIIPPQNLISNIGYDSYASHTAERIFPLGLELCNCGCRVNWERLPNKLYTASFENALYTKVYRLSNRHRISLLLSSLLDWWRFPKSKRLPPLISRWKESIATNP